MWQSSAGTEMYLHSFDTPLGRMALAARRCDAISHLYFPQDFAAGPAEQEIPLLAEGRRQLLEYFFGTRTSFLLPLCPEGTPFQRKVWRVLAAIAYGKTMSYGDVAAAIGIPGGARAVGGACHRNPIPVLIPCHRVVGADGSLTGFSGGLDLKKQLLLLELNQNATFSSPDPP